MFRVAYVQTKAQPCEYSEETNAVYTLQRIFCQFSAFFRIVLQSCRYSEGLKTGYSSPLCVTYLDA